MGTKIGNSIKYFTSMSRCYLRDYEPLSTAVETMRKYQKIQEIMAKRPKDMISSNPTLRAISEVLADGNDD